jgi:hypothetical protein
MATEAEQNPVVQTFDLNAGPYLAGIDRMIETTSQLAARNGAVAAVARAIHERLCNGDCSMKPGATGMPVGCCDGEPSDAEFDAAAMAVEAAEPFLAAIERAQVAEAARAMSATYPVTLDPEPGTERTARRADFPFADYLADVPAGRQGATGYQCPNGQPVGPAGCCGSAVCDEAMIELEATTHA